MQGMLERDGKDKVGEGKTMREQNLLNALRGGLPYQNVRLDCRGASCRI